jgi:hypothetical protein
MNNYLKPDGWVILKIQNPEGCGYKLFSSWRGGYLGNDSWRLNSGITSIEKENDYYVVKGNSSTEYAIHPSTFERLGAYNGSVLETIIGDNDVTIINIEQYLEETLKN